MAARRKAGLSRLSGSTSVSSDGTVVHGPREEPVVVDLINTMLRLGVKKMKTPDGHEIELHDSAFVPAAPQMPPSVEPVEEEYPKLCQCGHDLVTEHTSEGCLHGCAVSVCTAKLTAPPAP